jgi:plasmid maintenance system killer protein
MQKNSSEVAQFRQTQALQEEAAQQGLTGLAIVASHELITARMERGAVRILQLLQAGKQEEALALMSTETWGLEETKGA